MTTESAVPAKVFVLHVRKGYEDRAAFMESSLGKLGIRFDYLLEGDKDDLNDEILDRWFAGELHGVTSATSCALKHLLAYRRILDEGLDGALILEDDISLSRKFTALFSACMAEKEARGIGDMVLSFEDTSLLYVAGSIRKKGQHIYPAVRDRYTGCYYITAGCARMILDYVEAHKCHLPIDRYHTFLIDAIGLPYYWSHPTEATQGSKNGQFGSSISVRDFNRRAYLGITRPLKVAYKKLLYRFR